MTLPVSRNTTYSPESPVRSADLNDIQDCIVGEKHGERALVLSASAFQAKAGGGGVLGDGQWTFSATTTLVADIGRFVPVGTRLVSVAWYYNRGGAGTITRRVRTRELTAPGSAADLATPSYPIADSTGSAHEVAADICNYTIPDDESIWLEILFDNAAHVFVGAALVVDRL